MDPSCHEDAYVGLLAVIWDSLERIGERLRNARERDSSVRLDEVRIELIQWKNASRHFARRSDLPEGHLSRLQWQLWRTEEILDEGLHESVDSLSACIRRAQYGLFEDVPAVSP